MSNLLYTKASVKSDFIAGKVLAFTVTRNSVHDGWYLSFVVKGHPRSVYLTEHNGQIKIIKSLDAVVNLLETVGFKVRLLTHY